MSHILAVIFALLAGVSTALEAFINGQLEKVTTPLVATFISLIIGASLFFISILVSGDYKVLLALNTIKPKLLLGGVFGGCIIYFTVKSVGTLGVSNTLILIVVSQVLVGLVIDLIVVGSDTMHLYKFIGIILLGIGTFFIVN